MHLPDNPICNVLMFLCHCLITFITCVINPEIPLFSPNQEFLHSKDLLHGNIRARSVLVTKEFTAKLWGLHGVYTRKNQAATQRDDPSMKKWQAPEVLAKRPAGQSSDM